MGLTQFELLEWRKFLRVTTYVLMFLDITIVID